MAMTVDGGKAGKGKIVLGKEVDEALTPEQSVEEPAEVLEEGAASPAASENGDAPMDENPIQAELDQTRQQMMRIQADFDNFRKRTRLEKEELQQYATRKVFAELLPVLDNFDRALTALADQDAADDIKTGMDMVRRQLLTVLENGGVKPMEVLGQPFDPNLHEGVMQVPAEGQEAGIVVQELQKGYWLHNKVLRPAMVAVTS